MIVKLFQLYQWIVIYDVLIFFVIKTSALKVWKMCKNKRQKVPTYFDCICMQCVCVFCIEFNIHLFKTIEFSAIPSFWTIFYNFFFLNENTWNLSINFIMSIGAYHFMFQRKQKEMSRLRENDASRWYSCTFNLFNDIYFV